MVILGINIGILRDGLLVKVKNSELVRAVSEEDFDLVPAVNVKGVFNCGQALAPGGSEPAAQISA